MPPEARPPLGPRPELWLPDEGSVRLAVRGASMRPTLEEGDCVEVRRCAPEELRAGDVAAFARGGELTVHRVLATGPDGFLEMGDGQERGNWQPWPLALGLVAALEPARGARLDLTGEEARRAARALATRMRRRHRLLTAVEALPGSLTRRVARRLLRPWLRPAP